MKKKAKKYDFVPAYYEWHFTDSDGNVLLNWIEPLGDLYIEFDDDGNWLEEPRPMTYDQILAECEAFINIAWMNFENDTATQKNDMHGCYSEDYEKLPKNAAKIMACALYDYYFA